VQSDLGDCFSEIKKHLMQETKVCFIGTPCQVYGLKSYLRKEYDNLVTVDLVCHGTPSPKLWKKYLDSILFSIGQAESHNLQSIHFEISTNGYKKPS
jgi:coenzyme F420-reducing hydrogenase beta subunit